MSPTPLKLWNQLNGFLQNCVNRVQWEDTPAPNLSIFYNERYSRGTHMNVCEAAAGVVTILDSVIDFLW